VHGLADAELDAAASDYRARLEKLVKEGEDPS
jgi:hypothetical protein